MVQRWSTAEVSAWLSQQEGLPASVAAKADEMGVNGRVLLEFDAAAWQELGVTSAIHRASLIAAVKTAARRSPAMHAAAAQEQEHEREIFHRGTYDEALKHGDHFSADAGGAAEHFLQWHNAVAQANAEGANAKNHFLGFLGMYNVLSLLVFTIAFTCLLTTVEIVEWIDAFLFLLYGWSAWYSFAGINATSIAYNTTSACSDANATALFKMPSMARYLKQCNDMCLFGSFPLLGALVLLVIKHIYIPFDSTQPVKIFAVVAQSLLALWFFWKARHNQAASPMTHAVMFGGLMADEAISPDGWASGSGAEWALSTPGEEIEAYIFGRTLDRITAAPISGPGGQRRDKKIRKSDVAGRVAAMLQTYREEALRKYSQIYPRPAAATRGGPTLEAGVAADAETVDEDEESRERGVSSKTQRRKLPLMPGITSHSSTARVVPAPVIAASVGFH
jgi:hypothetical protein